ncbi:MAG: D-ribose pyranase [Breznakia sp.]
MKKNGILNRDINNILGKLGHTDKILIADLGLPIPENVYCIDLTLIQGIPSFNDVLTLISEEMLVEKYYVSEDIRTQNKKVEKEIMSVFPNTEVTYMKHEDFKELSKEVKVIIRSGENTPYANIILQSKCLF